MTTNPLDGSQSKLDEAVGQRRATSRKLPVFNSGRSLTVAEMNELISQRIAERTNTVEQYHF